MRRKFGFRGLGEKMGEIQKQRIGKGNEKRETVGRQCRSTFLTEDMTGQHDIDKLQSSKLLCVRETTHIETLILI